MTSYTYNILTSWWRWSSRYKRVWRWRHGRERRSRWDIRSQLSRIGINANWTVIQYSFSLSPQLFYWWWISFIEDPFQWFSWGDRRDIGIHILFVYLSTKPFNTQHISLLGVLGLFSPLNYNRTQNRDLLSKKIIWTQKSDRRKWPVFIYFWNYSRSFLSPYQYTYHRTHLRNL